MKGGINELLNKYKNKGVLVDTNILLLWFVGSLNPARISRFNRTEKFSPEDYDLLVRILYPFGKVITTANSLDNFRLGNYLQKLEIDAIKFNHIRRYG